MLILRKQPFFFQCTDIKRTYREVTICKCRLENKHSRSFGDARKHRSKRPSRCRATTSFGGKLSPHTSGALRKAHHPTALRLSCGLPDVADIPGRAATEGNHFLGYPQNWEPREIKKPYRRRKNKDTPRVVGNEWRERQLDSSSKNKRPRTIITIERALTAINDHHFYFSYCSGCTAPK